MSGDGGCPECGEPLRARGRFCPACGWDADLEERDEGYLDGVDLPDDAAYEDTIHREGLAPATPGLTWFVALAVAAGLTALVLLGFF